MTQLEDDTFRDKPKSLRVLAQESPLRKGGNFLAPLNWESDHSDSSPRALRSLSRIVDGGLCHRCGTCVGICPTGVLSVDDEEYPRVKNLAACTDCDLCVKVCPGDEFNYAELQKQHSGANAELTETHGSFELASIAYAEDSALREQSTSGGLVSAILIDLLKNKEIDGALVIAPDETTLWKGKAIIARSASEILNTAKSKYAITATNVALAEIRQVPGRYAVVGLPCQLHGVAKAVELDERLRERIVLTIGLCCHAAIEHEAFKIIWESLGDKASRVRKFISRVGKHPGTPHVQLDDGSQYPVYFGDRTGYRPTSIEVINILYRLYTPERCMTCFDAMAEFADIAVGDPWMAPPDKTVDFYKGWSFSLVRTRRGLDTYERCLKRQAFRSHTLTKREALACNELMSSEKRWRAFRVIETQRRQGKPIPRYGNVHQAYPKHSGVQFIKTELHMLSHVFVFLPKLRAAVLRFFLGKGYWLFWLNSKRRALRFFIRDTRERIRRSLKGRE